MIVSKKPFEVFVGALVLYYVLIVFLFEPISFKVKIDFILSGISVWIVFYFVSLAFGKEMAKYKNKLLVLVPSIKSKNSLTKNISKLIALCLPFVILLSLLEYATSSMYIPGGSVAIGFPLSIYSFSINRIIFANLVVNLVLYAATMYFLGTILIDESKKV